MNTTSMLSTIAVAASLMAGAPLIAQNSAPENLLPAEGEKVTEPMPDFTTMQPPAGRAADAQPKAKPRTAAPPTESEATGQARESVADAFGDDPVFKSSEVVQETPADLPLVLPWTAEQAEELAAAIDGIGAEGLDPDDYDAASLRFIAGQGPSPALDEAASKAFVWLVEDLRDGRTPMEGRKQWFVMDPDADRMPTGRLLADALEKDDIAGTLAALHPTHPDYALLRTALAETPESDTKRRKQIRANMDRWRWLPRDLGRKYLMTNVPEYQLRLTVNDKIIKTYRTVVGKPGRTATPQLAEMVEGVIFNPTWTVPQSIVKGEGLGARVLGNPGWAKAQGYTASKGANGWVTVVQQPGPTNSLGLMKLDMPNRHAIFLHDTPSRHLFKRDARALSHGCIRVEGARTLAMTMAILGNMDSKADIPVIQQEVQQITGSGKYTAYPLKDQWPVYITYFTMAQDVNGKLTSFGDIYGRDAAVIAAFDAPRIANRSRVQGEEIIPIEAPGA